jgi:hypothetical protein
VRKDANGCVEIGETSAADVYLHGGLIGTGSQTGVLRDDPGAGYHANRLAPVSGTPL